MNTASRLAPVARFSRCAGAAGLVALLAALPAPAFADGVAQLKAFVQETRSARADFSQTVFSKSGRRPQQSAGVMAFSRPGKLRWEITRPHPQLMVADGKKLWIYDPELKQVTVKPVAAALGATPAAILAGEGGAAALEKNFTLSELPASDGVEWVEARPRAKDSSFDKLKIGFAGGQLQAMELSDNFGQVTLLQFGPITRNGNVPASLFQFVVPAGTDVLGE